MDQKTQQLVRELTDVPALRSDEIRRRATQVLRRAVGCDGVIFYNVHRGPQGLIFGALHTDVACEPPRSGSLVPSSPTLNVGAPRSFERNAFSPGTERWVKLKQRHPLVEAAYRPNRVYDDLRMLSYQAGHFVGWIGAVRQEQGLRSFFTRADAAKLAPLTKPIIKLLTLASDLDQKTTRARAYLVMGADGQLENHTADVEHWLSRDRTAALRSWMRGLATGSEQEDCTIESVHACAVRLLGTSPARYVVRLDGIPLLREGGIDALTRKEREVALAACAGSPTVSELAQRVGIRAGTVRVHLKQIYKKLCIASRLELAREVDAWHASQAGSRQLLGGPA